MPQTPDTTIKSKPMKVQEEIKPAGESRKIGRQKPGFTPGPWMYRPNPGRTKEDWTFHVDRQGTQGRMNWGILIAACWAHVSESAEANARLIAAAPTLYEALKATSCRFSRVRECVGPEMCDRCAALSLVDHPEEAQTMKCQRCNTREAIKNETFCLPCRQELDQQRRELKIEKTYNRRGRS